MDIYLPTEEEIDCIKKKDKIKISFENVVWCNKQWVEIFIAKEKILPSS